MAWQASRAKTLASLAALTASLAACGPDEARVDGPDQYSMLDSGYEWPLDAFGLDDAGEPGSLALPPLPEAQPMARVPQREAASYARERGYAPRYYDQYDDYYEPEPANYADDAGTDTFAYLALAALLGGVLADSPPDYAFDYDGVQPWVWKTGDRYMRYAEPIRDGYRYYYYEPGAARPFLVRDPYYSYGYRGSDLVAVYDRRGRVLDRNRVWAQRRVASRYYDRGADLYLAGRRGRHRGVAAPLWQQQRTVIVRDQRNWERARSNRDGWRNWTRVHEPAVEARWAQEQVARRYAANRFDRWRSADYRGAAPRFYREARQNASVRKAVALQQRRIAARQHQRNARMERIAERGGNIPTALRRQQIERRADRRIAATRRAEQVERRIERRADIRRTGLTARRGEDNANRQLLARRAQRAVLREDAIRQSQTRRGHAGQSAAARRQSAARLERVAERRNAIPAALRRQRTEHRADRRTAATNRTARIERRAEARPSRQVQARQREARQSQVQQRRAQQAQARQREARQSQVQQRRAQQAQARQREARQSQVQRRRVQQAQARQREARQSQVQQRRAQQAQARQREARQSQVQQRRAQQAQARQREARQSQVQQRRAQQAQARQRDARQLQVQQRRTQQVRAERRSQARAAQQQSRGPGGAHRRFAHREQ